MGRKKMNKRSAVLITACVVLFAGCGGGGKESFTRYPSVCIPGFTIEDYVLQLSEKDSELVYNAVCNLGMYADGLGDVLWGEHEEDEPDPDELRQAQNVYSNVVDQLASKDPLVVAASLRFLQLFACGHEERTELIDPVCQIRSRHPQVQFEQVNLLSRLIDDTTRLPEPLLRRLLESRSWIVSRTACQLIGRLHDEPLRKELIKRYRATHDEKERLILLGAWSEQPEPEEIALIEEECLTADSERIRACAQEVLIDNLADPAVFAWVADHYDQPIFEEGEEPDDIFEMVYEADQENADWAVRYLFERGHVPGDDFLSGVNERFESKPDNVSSNLLAIEGALLDVPETALRWQTLREKTAAAKQDLQRRCDALQAELDPLKEEFIMEVETLLAQHEVPEGARQKFLKPIADLKAAKVVRKASP